MEKTMDYMGEILLNVFRFVDSKFSPNLVLDDPITQGAKVLASTMFSDINDRWHLREDSLPGYLLINAVAVDQDELLLETSTFNPDAFNQLIAETRMPFRYDEKAGAIVDLQNTTVLNVSKPEIFEIDGQSLPRRCLCRLSLGVSAFVRWQAIMLIDKMFTNEVFVSDEDGRTNEPQATVSRPELRVQLNMSLMQTLKIVQRPILSLKASTRTQQVQQLLTIQKMMAVQRQICSMSEDELTDFTLEQVQKYGEKVVIRMYLFVLAGQVKKAAKLELTWKQARAVAKTLLEKQSA